MKKYLVLLCLVSTGVVTISNTKQAIDNYEIPEMKIRINHKQYLENIKNNIEETMNIGDKETALGFLSWSTKYLKEFKAIEKKYAPPKAKIQDISEFEEFVNKLTKYFINNSENKNEIDNEFDAIEQRIMQLYNDLKDAVLDFNQDKSYQTKATLNKLIKQYDIALRRYTYMKTNPRYAKNKLTVEQYNKLESIETSITFKARQELIVYIKLFLGKISTSLEETALQINGKPITVDRTREINDLHQQYLDAKDEIALLEKESITSEFGEKILKINESIVKLKGLFETSEKELIKLWNEVFVSTEVILMEHIAKMQDEGEWEKLEALVLTFKKNVKDFQNFRSKNQDLHLDYQTVIKRINEIRTNLTRVTYLGITKNESSGTWSKWHLSEPAWRKWAGDMGAGGLLIPPFAVTGEVVGRIVAARWGAKLLNIGETIVGETVTNTFAKAIFLGSWTGLAIGFGLFAVPAYVLNNIKTNGAGLSFKYNYFGYLTGFLAPTIEIKKTAEPQTMKYLNLWDIDKLE